MAGGGGGGGGVVCVCDTLIEPNLWQELNIRNSKIKFSPCGPSLVPRPLPTREKGLVHTDCACARLYPESGYIVYSRKIFSKLSFYDYVIF